jgi:hypothetical protein
MRRSIGRLLHDIYRGNIKRQYREVPVTKQQERKGYTSEMYMSTGDTGEMLIL